MVNKKEEPRESWQANRGSNQTNSSHQDNQLSGFSQVEKDVVLARFSVATNEKGALSKTMSQDPATGAVVKGGKCSMSNGTLQQKTVSSFQKFAEGLRRLGANQALVHGISEHKTTFVVAESRLKKTRGGRPADALPVISRTTKFLDYPDGPGLLMLDHDKARSNSVAEDKKALRILKPDELIETISTIFPEIGSAGWVSTPSTSSCIFDKNGVELRGESSGFHLYCFVENARDIPRFLKVLGKHLFLAGFGRVELSRSGTILYRTFVDLLVGSPERLDFAAGAVCKDGLVQRLPAPFVKEGSCLNTALLPDLTPDEEQSYFAIRYRLAELAKPDQAIVQAEYVERETCKLSAERSISEDEARQIILSRQDHMLADGDLLCFAHLRGKPVTVAEVLSNPTDFDKKTLADPLEPEYDGGSLSKARFYWNDGRTPIIRSFAHGVTQYNFERFKKASTEEQTHPWFQDALGNGSVSRFLDNNPPSLDWIFEGSLLARTTGMLVGPGAAGKSTLSILMLMAVATGRDILPGVFTPTISGKVLGVFGEDDEVILHHRIHAMVSRVFAGDKEAQELIRQNMLIVTTTGEDVRLISQATRDLGESCFFTEVFEAVKKVENLRLIVLDPASRFHGAEENDNGAGTFLVSLIERIAQKTGAAVLLLHHVSKKSGINQQGFDLEAAMHQDSARGASGLTNGVRWQCNLFGLPEKDCKRLIGVKDAKPGQYLAVKVSKKNYGLPEKVKFLERQAGGVLRPFEPIEKEIDVDLEQTVKGLVLDFVLSMEGRQLTKRMLVDGKCRDWKNENPAITRPVVEQTIAACILRGELFEHTKKNGAGRTIFPLSRYPEPTIELEPENQKIPEEIPEGKTPENRRTPDEGEPTVYNSMNLIEKDIPEEVNRINEALRFVTPCNCDTVEPEIVPPFRGAYAPSGIPGAVPPMPDEDENAEYY